MSTTTRIKLRLPPTDNELSEGEEELTSDDADADSDYSIAKPQPTRPSGTLKVNRQRQSTDSEDEDYGRQRKVASVDSGDSWKRGAARRVVTYDETVGNEDLLESASESEPMTGQYDINLANVQARPTRLTWSYRTLATKTIFRMLRTCPRPT
jgi:hypothetical protein